MAAQRQARLLAEAREVASKISGCAVTIKRQAASEDKIFGAVTNGDIAEALASA
jgi:ribosomal protein L9